MGKKAKHYRKQLAALQLELIELQRWLRLSGKRLVVLFEGRDAAGKGGVIKRITDKMDNRGYRIAALKKPNERESGQWYFQRYVAELPTAGEFVLFDRSWYNRAVVEPAMEFCSAAEYERFLDAAPLFERLLTDDGVILVKYWLAVDQDEEERRFAARAKDPRKRWKLSPVDQQARHKYAQIGQLRDVMIERTHSEHAPWFVVDFNDKKRGRINLIRHLLEHVPRREVEIPEVKLKKLRGKLGREDVTAKALWVPDSFAG